MKIEPILPNFKINLLIFFALNFCFEINAQTADISKACSPIAINFTAPVGYTSWYWDFKDGVTSQLQNPSHVFSNSGIYNIEFRESQNDILVGSIVVTILQKPDLQIEVLPDEGCVPLMCDFKDVSSFSSDFNILSKDWIFGDGGYGSGQTATHEYNKDGYFDVGFSVKTDVPGCDVVQIFPSKILVRPLPNVWFSTDPEPPTTCLIPFKVNFKDETTGAKPFKYSWDFGSGNIFTGLTPPEQVFNSIGIFPVKLSVTDLYGCKSEVSRDINTGKIEINLMFPDTVCNGQQEFKIANKSSVGSHSWTFGPDCSIPTSNFRSPSIRYLTPGLKTIHYTLTGVNGSCKLDTTIHIYVLDLKSSVSFDFDSNACALPITFNFHYKGNANNFFWQFGVYNLPQKYGTSVLRNPSVTIPPDNNNFSVNGKKSLLALVGIVSNFGCSLDTGIYIKYGVLTSVFKADKYRGCIPFTPKLIDCSYSVQKIVKWIWDFGDGTIITKFDSIPPMHTYDTCGVYYAKLTIENEIGCSDESYLIPFKVCGCLPPINVDGYCNFENTILCHGDSIKFKVKNDPFWDEIRVESDNFRLHHCPNEKEFSWVFDHEPGNHKVIETGISSNGDVLTLINKKEIIVLGPWARGAYMFAGCNKPYTFMFSDSSQNATSIKWIFPDGTTSNLKNVSHSFPSNGKYEVLLVAYNDLDGCPPDTTRFNLVTRDFIPKIISEDEYCVGYVPFFVSGDFYTSCTDGLIWHFGDGILPQNTTQYATAYFDTAGVYKIEVLGHDENGCPYTTSKNIVIQDIEAKFSPLPDYICFPHNLVLNDKSVISNSSTIEKYIWLLNDKLISEEKDDVVPVDTTGMNKPDSIIIKLIVISKLGCRDTASHIIRFYKPKSAILLSDSIFCANEKILFDAKDDTLHGSYLNYQWDFGNNNYSAIQSPSYFYSKEGKYTVKLLHTENSSGCQDSLFQNVYIQKQPNASFTTDVDSLSELCYPHEVFFKPTDPEYDTLSYSWDFGNGQSSNFYDVATVYGKGSYTARLIVTNEQGCTDTTYTSFLLNGPSGDFVFDKTKICKGEPITFILKDTSGVGSWLWDFGDGVIQPGDNPVSHVYTVLPPGDTTIAKLVLNDIYNNCQFTVEKVVPIINTTADFELAFGLESVCPGTLTKIKNLSHNGEIYKWIFSNGFTSDLFEPEFKIDLSGSYTVKLVVTNLVAGCTDSITKVIKVSDLELPVLPDVTICEGDTTTIGLANELPNSSYIWMPADGLEEPLKFQTKAFPKSTQTYILSVVQPDGCSAKTQVKVNVIPKYNNALEFEEITLKGTYVTLKILVSGTNYKYVWQPSALLNCATCSEPQYLADTSTTFNLTLQDSLGCGTYNIIYKIKVIVDKVDLPNVFTPNGDGKNDYFNVVVPGGSAKDIRINTFEIYNRWGQKLNTNIIADKGWDGTHDGIPCPSDVYVYVLEIGFLNGDTKKYKGDVSLVR